MDRGYAMLRVWVLFLFAVGLSACGGNDGTSKESQEGDGGAYTEQSCQYGTDDGDPATQVGRTELPTGQLTQGYFEKAYNSQWLDAVAHTSIRGTIDYIVTSTGANVYRGESAFSKSCKPLAIASAMPSAVASEWRNAVKAVEEQNRKTGSTGFVAGLYLPKMRAIIVREDASRWTLVHELMHHNFKSQPTGSGTTSDEDIATVSTMARHIDTIARSHMNDREKVRQITPYFLRMSEASDRLLVGYPLEEVAIEATLQDGVDAGTLTYVPTKSYANATWYIQHSQAVVSNYYEGMDEVYSQLRQAATRTGATEEYSALSQYYNTKMKRVEQLNEVLRSRRRRSNGYMNGAMFMEAASQATPAEGTAPCSESERVYRLFEDTAAKLGEAALRL